MLTYQPPSSNVLRRTFMIRPFGATNCIGTAFGINWGSSRILVSAKHIFDGFAINRIEIQNGGNWLSLDVEPLYCPSGIDLVAFNIAETVWPNDPISVGTKGSYLGEDVYALGYPLALFQDGTGINNGYPIPFVAKGCLAALDFGTNIINKKFYLSVALDKGYSGGPVVLARSRNERPQVLGFISHSLRYREITEIRHGQDEIIRNPANLVQCVPTYALETILGNTPPELS